MRKINFAVALAAVVAIVVAEPRTLAVQDPASAPPRLTCSPDRPVASPGQSVNVTAWVAGASSTSSFRWSATAGVITATGSTATWRLADVAMGAYAADVEVIPAGERCRVIVTIAGDQARGVGRHFLLGADREDVRDGRRVDYGLYSYLLLPSPPAAASKARYESALRAYVEAIVDVERLLDFLGPREVNATFVPITKPLDEEALKDQTAWLLQAYNYARAQALLERVPGGRSSPGPFLVSCIAPLSRCTSDVLVQDLSSVPPRLVRTWVREFLNHAAQEDLRVSGRVVSLSLRMRTTIAVLADGVGPVTKALIEVRSLVK